VWPRRSDRKSRRASGSPAYYTVIEPGTTALRLLVVEVVDGQATVWGWAEGPGWPSLGGDVQAVADACRDTSSQAERMAQDRAEFWFLPDQVLVGLPASLLRGRAWPLVQRRAHPERPIDERELEALLDRALRLTVNHLQGIAAEQPEADASDWLLVDAVSVALTVDGRGVTDPVGFRGQEMGAMVFAALAPLAVVELWGEVAQQLEFSALTLTPASLALAAGVSEPQGMLVDVGGATTDLTWFRAGRPLALESLPIGGEVLTGSLMNRWNLAHDRAERLKRVYGSGKLADEGKAQVLGVLSPLLQAWREQVEGALAPLNQDEPLPQRFFLMGGGAQLPEMAETVRSLAWSERLHFARYPQVRRLRPTDVAGVVNRTDRGREPGDAPALALAAWAAHQSQAPGRPDQILAALCRG
jgi:cell division ATPase FtsA